MLAIPRRTTAALVISVIASGALALGSPTSIPRASAAGPNAVTEWSVVSQNAVTVGRPAGSAFYLHAIALVAIHLSLIHI